MKKRILVLMMAAAMLLSACGAQGSSSGSASGSAAGSAAGAGDGKTYTLTMTGQDAEGLPSTEAMHWIADEVESRTNGKVTIKVYPSNQLGDAKLQYEGIMDGSIDMLLGYLDPTYDIAFDLTTIPFLASNYDEMAYICSQDSNCYKIFQDHALKTDMVFMGFFLNGVNGIFSVKPLGDYLNPSAKKDCLIRIANSVTYKLGVEALGYSTITIPWSDTYTSLQTGIMDGMTGIPSYMVNQNFGDLAKYYVAMDMFMETNVVLMSPSTRDSLPADYVTTIQQVVTEACENSIGGTKDNVDTGIEALKNRGVEILPITDEQRADVAKQVHDKIWPDLQNYFGEDLLSQAEADITAAAAKG